LLPLRLPGHDGRLNEPPRTNLRALAAELAGDLQSIAERPYTLLGHSLGAWLAFEIAREMRRRGCLRPALLVVAASRAPHLRLTERPIYDLPDDRFLDAVDERYGGIPPAVRASDELIRLLLPSLRADLQMAETYQYDEEPPLDVEVLALGGVEDSAISPAQLESWREHTTQAFSSRLLPGGHFFLFHGSESVGSADSRTPPRAASAALQIIIDRMQQLRVAGGNL
jgi:surfactin synthase thioesterase subunit